MTENWRCDLPSVRRAGTGPAGPGPAAPLVLAALPVGRVVAACLGACPAGCRVADVDDRRANRRTGRADLDGLRIGVCPAAPLLRLGRSTCY
jgi:hypothetical protein